METTIRIWRAPVCLGLITALGLTAALFADGWGDVLSWLSLAIPVVVMTLYSLRPRTATIDPRWTAARSG